jgi:hypothetical protein
MYLLTRCTAYESKSTIFLMLEPNCSIIAACLPCYGPLLEHGRTLDSIVGSVRSVLSLRSRSSDTANSSRKGKGSDKHWLERHESFVSGDSQVELHKISNDIKEWKGLSPAHGQSTARAEPVSHHGQDMEIHDGSVIEVVHTYETRVEDV